MYAIIEDGSHQFRVREGDRIRVDRRSGKPGDQLVFSKVLLITGEDGHATIGAPAVDGRRSWPKLSINSVQRRSSSRSFAVVRTCADAMVIGSPTRWCKSRA